MRTLHFLLGVLALAALSGCGKKAESSKETHSAHVHTAPHGGTLVEIGDHAYNLELVRDDVAGKLTAYVLDGHAENFVRDQMSAPGRGALAGLVAKSDAEIEVLALELPP